MEIEIVVEGEHPASGRRWPCVNARATFVGIDETRKPAPIPPLLLDTAETRASQEAGEARASSRLMIKPRS